MNNQPTGRGVPVVITGVGLATCLGLSSEDTWQRVVRGECGIGAMPALESAPAGGDKPGGNGGQAPDLPAEWMPDRPREVRYLRWVIDEALRQSVGAWGEVLPYPAARCACILGTTLHGMRQGGRFFRTGDFSQLGSFLASHTQAAALRGLPVGGMAATTCSACSSGLGAIALGATLLQSGQADLVIAGGYDPVSEYAYAGFDSMRLVAAGKLKPFCKGREGMKLAEGYAVMVLERAPAAAARGARVLAEVGGIGESADAHHLTHPHPEGEGALRAISAALSSAGLTGSDIGLIAAHATGTPGNDAAEFAAFSRAFGDRLSGIPVVAFKSHLGHTLGAAGGAELILSLLALRDQVAPPTANVQREDLEYPSLLIGTQARAAKIEATLNTSLGFGGANTCIVLRSAKRDLPRMGRLPVSAPREVLITGVGFLAPGMVGNDALVARLLGSSLPPNCNPLEEGEYAHLINARRVRRMSEYSKLTLAATALALENASVTDVPIFADRCAAILGTTHGSAQFCEDYYRPIVEQGMAAANPVLFAEGVPNAASAQLSLMLGIKGSCQTIIGSRTAGLDALRLASLRIASGAWDRAIVGAAEENDEVLLAAYRHAGLHALEEPSGAFEGERGFVTSCGAVSLILESRGSVESRLAAGSRGSVLGVVGTGATAFGDLRADGAALVDRVLGDIGDPRDVASSANGTWIDRVESAGIERMEGRRHLKARTLTMSGRVAEMFSVGPLAAIAGALLTRRLPVVSGTLPTHMDLGSRAPTSVGFLACDYGGMVTGVCIDFPS